MKTSRKLVSLFLALVLLAGVFSISALAAGDPTVTIYVQSLSRGEDGMIQPDSVRIFNQNDPIVVSVQSGATLKDAINAACATGGSLITNDVWVADDPQYLEALTVNNVFLKNENSFEYDTPVQGYATYKGSSWMYFNGAPDQIPANTDSYPDISLGNAIVTSDITITLSYESMTYVYPMT